MYYDQHHYWVYILRCNDGSYYTGVTNSLERRLYEHNQGVDEKCYTYHKRPVEIVFTEYTNDINAAIEREKQIKGWSRKKKEALIKSNWRDLSLLSMRSNDKEACHAEDTASAGWTRSIDKRE